MSADRPTITSIRHGETPWSLSGQHTGRTDLELTDVGEEQAKALASVIESTPFDLVLCSPMVRARHTAELAGLTPYEIDEDLREWDYGDFEGLTSEQIHETDPDWTIWHGPWPSGETAAQVAARADRVVARVRASGHRSVVVVAHGHILRVLAARWLGAEVAVGSWLALDTATVSTLDWEHDQPVIRYWNVAPG